MTLYTLNPIADRRWTEFVHSHPRASVFHTPGWLEALRRTYGYEPIAYTTSPPSVPLKNGVVFCHIRSWLTGRRLVSLPFADHCEPLVDTHEHWQEILDFLRHELEGGKYKYVQIRPLSTEFLVTESGFARDTVFSSHILDLSPALDDLFQGLHKDSIQRKIKRAAREAVDCWEGISEPLLRTFYRLFLVTRRRHGVPPQPIDWFRNLMCCMGDQLKIRVASKNGQAIAGILTLSFRNSLLYKYGGSDARSHNLGAMPFLFWQAIQEAKEHGLERLDLGRSDCDNAGLNTFKDRLGAVRSMLTYLRCSAPRASAQSHGRAKRVAQQIVAQLPEGLFVTAGKLLYRHVG